MEKAIKNGDPIADDKNKSHNMITEVLYLRYALYTFRLAFIILNICYFLGLVWFTFCTVEQDFILGDPLIENPDVSNFIGYFEWTFEKKSMSEIALGSGYFAFTTLSTVGFGDLNPRSDIERIFGAFILLCGVAVFSTIMGSFIEMVEKVGDLNTDHGDSNGLIQFFGCLQFINNKRPIPQALQSKIEDFFEHAW